MTRYYFTGRGGHRREVFGFAAGLVALLVIVIAFLPTLVAVALWHFMDVPGGLCILLAIPTQFVWFYGTVNR